MKTRPAPKSHTPWIPHPYQERASDHLVDNAIAALFLDPGLGKTSITLDAFSRLKEAGVARKMLVVAPLRVCQLVWRQEAAGWSQFRHLRFSLVHGSPKKKEEALAADADIYLINPEGIAWLAKQYQHRKHRFPFDTVTIDELTKFKNARSQRSKLLRPLLSKVARKWGLTGTPIPNGYMDLFGQILMLDDGRALGPYITHYRNRFFQQGYTGFDWTLRAGAAADIEERIRPYVLRMSAEDYLDLPTLVPDVREIELPPKVLATYKTLKKEMLVEVEGQKITAENSGGVYTKLKQLANGAAYVERDGKREFIVLHDYKLDALEELVEELQGNQLLVGYEFQHDAERLLERFPNASFIGSGVSEKRAMKIERDWNAGEIEMLIAHPASVGHGLNFQKSGAGHLCWFSTTVDLELYEQFLKRILRQGNTAERVINHALVVQGTVDSLSVDIVSGKALTQARFLQALAEAVEDDQGGSDMAMKKPARRLARKAEVEETEDEAPKTKGWGKRPAEDDEDEDEDEDEEAAPPRKRRVQREAVASRLAGDEEEDEDGDEEEDEAPRRTRRAFSEKVKRRLKEEPEEEGEDEDEADEEEDEPDAPPARKRRAAKAPPAEEEADTKEDDTSFEVSVSPPLRGAHDFDLGERRRARALELAGGFADRLGLNSEAQVVRAAKEFEKYLKS